ncbi:Mediator of RNA polymerase II transcription subunit 10b like, partial [Actinidia chinensis var. chinensis]
MDNSAEAAGGGNGLIVSENMDAETSEDQKQNLKQVINSIHKTLGLIHPLYLFVSSFNVASQLPLLQRLNSLVMDLEYITKFTDKCDIQ